MEFNAEFLQVTGAIAWMIMAVCAWVFIGKLVWDEMMRVDEIKKAVSGKENVPMKYYGDCYWNMEPICLFGIISLFIIGPIISIQRRLLLKRLKAGNQNQSAETAVCA